MSSRGSVLSLVVAFVAACAAVSASQTLPEGDGAAIVMRGCVACHGVDLIAQQRLSRAGWEREVDKMTGWGAVVPPAERDVLIEHLASRYAPAPVAAHETAHPGAALLRSRCTVCHDTRLIDQQRLTREGWAREIDKMAAWGAAMTDAEKRQLLDYLSTR